MKNEKSNAVAPAKIEITQYNPLRADIEATKKQNANLVFQYDTAEGNKNARSHIYKMRQKKDDVERVRKSAKADALEYGRRVDFIASELTGELESMIQVHQKPIDEIDAKAAAAARAEADRIEAERLEKERIEREKQEAILAAERAEAHRVADELAAIKRQQEIERLQREAAEKARLEAERKAKAEQDAGAARERAAIDAKQRAEKERQDAIVAAERAKIEAEREKVEAEKRAIQAAKHAEEKAAREKLEAVKRATEEAERKQREKEETAERKRLADKQAEEKRLRKNKVRKSIIAEIAESICNEVADIGMPVAEFLAAAMLDGKISRVTVQTNQPESFSAGLDKINSEAQRAEAGVGR